MPERTARALAFALFLAAVTASAQTPAQTPDGPPPRAGDTVAWYTVRPGDTLIGVTIHYLGSPALWTENLRLNPQIRDVKHLKPGSRIRVIVSRQLPKRNALVDRVSRRVDAKPDPEPWATAHEGDLLKENDGVRTYEKSSADLQFDDGSHLTMTENSLLFLKEMRPAQRGPTSETIEIIDGQVDLTSRPKKKATAELHMVIGGTSISHNATGDRPVAARSRKASDAKAQVMVYGGSSVVASAGKRVAVGAGMGTQVEEGKAPEPPQKLLPAPATVEPAAEAVLRSTFSWNSVPDAGAYTVEIFRDAGATQLVERATGILDTSWRPGALPYGDFYWRATAVSKSGLDGFPAKLVHFRAVAELQGNVAEDANAAGSIEGAPPLAAVRLIAWRDDGNGVPDDADVAAGETRTDAAGRFAFQGLTPAVYWIAVDSLSIAPAQSVWAEQTFGSAGTLCSGGTRTTAGPCIGGRWAARSDDPRKLSTSKHLARVDTSDPAVRATPSFGFSFNVVDNADDAENRQGSLRQFIRNANAIAGPNAMRFLPPAGAGPWTIHCAKPLPSITDGGTSIDGIGQLQIDGGGGATGLVIEASNVQIRNTAILHAADGIVIRGGASGTVLLRNRFEDISGTAILFDPKGARPSQNRISEAEFVSVGTPTGSTGGAPPAGADGCVPMIAGFETVPGGIRSLHGKVCSGTAVEVYAGTVAGRTTARFVLSTSPARDGSFSALVEHMTDSTRVFVTATDKDGNTSLVSTSESTH